MTVMGNQQRGTRALELLALEIFEIKKLSFKKKRG